MKQASHSSNQTHKGSTDFPGCVYIAGTGRNGSTLLGILLSQDARVFFAGELTHIWKRGFQQNQLCSCGQPFLNCEFWRAVAKDCFGNDCDAKVSEIRRVGEGISSFQNLPKLILGRAHQANLVQQYCRVYSNLLASIARVSGCQTIIDSSKYPTDLAALIQGHVPLRVIHLIRDCRAVVYSWRTSKRRPEIHWKEEDMPHYGPVQTAMAWRTFNSLLERLGREKAETYRMLRYEDLVTDSAKHFRELSQWIGIETPMEERSTGSCNHSVSGNPCRFQSGPLRVAGDERWRGGISRSERFVVRVCCGSMQHRFGYGN